MKIPKFLPQKKKTYRASTARRLAASDEMDYEEMSEPNMKLSRALLIVLVLHVVAVAGIIAFNTIKSRQGAFPPRSSSTASAENESAFPQKGENVSANLPTAQRDEEKPIATATKENRRIETVKAALPVSAPAESGKVYVVVKGDNPVTIARHFKISESELLSINQIEDPRKLQIGQKLIIPEKAAKKRTAKE